MLPEMLRLGDIVFTVCLKRKMSPVDELSILITAKKKKAEHFKSAFQVDIFKVMCPVFSPLGLTLFIVKFITECLFPERAQSF